MYGNEDHAHDAEAQGRCPLCGRGDCTHCEGCGLGDCNGRCPDMIQMLDEGGELE